MQILKESQNYYQRNGRLAYAFLDSELKIEINNLIDKLCESNFDMKKSCNNYFEKVNEIANYFSEEQAEKIIKSEKDKFCNMLGNSVLKLMKEYKEITAETLLFKLYEVMSKLEEQENVRANSNDFINSLSINAKKEWARRMSYGSDEIER